MLHPPAKLHANHRSSCSIKKMLNVWNPADKQTNKLYWKHDLCEGNYELTWLTQHDNTWNLNIVCCSTIWYRHVADVITINVAPVMFRALRGKEEKCAQGLFEWKTMLNVTIQIPHLKLNHILLLPKPNLAFFFVCLHSAFQTKQRQKTKKKESGNIKIKIKIVFKKSVKKISDEYNICSMQIMKPSFLSGSPIFKTLSHKGLLQCRICPCLLCWNDAPGATLMVTLQAQQQHDEMRRAVCLPRYV